ncbi:MAG: class B sortase [Ruminococcaceae bacterium]|nr:class B sortase [Oscillospiraceae bacterium]
MKKGIKLICAVIFIVVLAIGILGMIMQRYGYEESDRAKSQAIEIANVSSLTTTKETTAATTAIETETITSEVEITTTEPQIVDEYAQSLFETDIAALSKVNKDVFGWIVIPDSTVSYPLLQGENNTYYLDYAWDGRRNAGGSIYLDYRNAPDFSDFHSIIYGHRMYSDAMFNSLKYYNDIDYLKTHPSVYIVTLDKVMRYDAFAAYDADAINGHSYRLGLKETEGQQAYFNYCLKNSVVDSGIVPSAADGDKVLTLSTCSADGSEKTRWVVHFVLSYEVKRNEF